MDCEDVQISIRRPGVPEDFQVSVYVNYEIDDGYVSITYTDTDGLDAEENLWPLSYEELQQAERAAKAIVERRLDV